MENYVLYNWYVSKRYVIVKELFLGVSLYIVICISKPENIFGKYLLLLY